jgi:hypothetical protein
MTQGETKMLRVLVAFDFEGIEDPDSDVAGRLIHDIQRDCETLRIAYGAESTWVDEAFVVTRHDNPHE